MIDLDTPPTRHARRPAIWTAVATVAAAGLLLGGATPTPPAIRVAVTVDGAHSATAGIWADGRHITPPIGRTMALSGTVDRVAVIGWAGEQGGRCSIIVDGRQVAEYTTEMAGAPVSCTWPTI